MSASPRLPCGAFGNERRTQNQNQTTVVRRWSFRAKRRSITCAELMRMNSQLNEGGVLSKGSERPNSYDLGEESLRTGAILPLEGTNTGELPKLIEGTSLLSDRLPSASQGKIENSSGYSSYLSSESLGIPKKATTSTKAQESDELPRLEIQVNALRNNLGVLKLLLSRLSFDVNVEETKASYLMMPPIRCESFSPELIEYGIRLAYLDILSPRQSVLVDANWLRGIELVIVHLFRYGVVSEAGIKHSAGLARCFKVLALIAAEIPNVTDMIFRVLEMIIRKRLSLVGDLHRQHMAWQMSLLSRNCPRLGLKLLELLILEFSSNLRSLHQNPQIYAFQRPVTFFFSNLILDILLQLPKGCGYVLKNIADDLRNIPANAHLLSLAKQDILDHVDLKLQPYAE